MSIILTTRRPFYTVDLMFHMNRGKRCQESMDVLSRLTNKMLMRTNYLRVLKHAWYQIAFFLSSLFWCSKIFRFSEVILNWNSLQLPSMAANQSTIFWCLLAAFMGVPILFKNTSDMSYQSSSSSHLFNTTVWQHSITPSIYQLQIYAPNLNISMP